VLRKLGASADRSIGRSACGGWFWKCRTSLNTRFASHPVSENGNAAGQSGDATSEYCNASGRNRYAARQHHAANYSGIDFAQRLSVRNSPGSDEIDAGLYTELQLVELKSIDSWQHQWPRR
jgi:hypothetical protein